MLAGVSGPKAKPSASAPSRKAMGRALADSSAAPAAASRQAWQVRIAPQRAISPPAPSDAGMAAVKTTAV